MVVAATQTGVKAFVKQHGTVSVQGTSRKRNEDRCDLQAWTTDGTVTPMHLSSAQHVQQHHVALQVDDEASQGEPIAYAGVFDGHG